MTFNEPKRWFRNLSNGTLNVSIMCTFTSFALLQTTFSFNIYCNHPIFGKFAHFSSRSIVYAKGKDDSDEWDNTFSEIIESSIDAGIKDEPSYDDTMYDEEENYSETSNID